MYGSVVCMSILSVNSTVDTCEIIVLRVDTESQRVKYYGFQKCHTCMFYVLCWYDIDNVPSSLILLLDQN